MKKDKEKQQEGKLTFLQRLTKFFSKINVALTVMMIVATVLCYSAAYINPDKFPLSALAGMAYPYVLVLDMLYMLLLAFLKKYSAFIMLATIGAGYKFIDITVQLNPMHYVDDFDESDSSFSLMSFNVRLLDRYNWIKGKNDTRTKIFEFLKYESPDVMCFQEFYNNSKDSITNEQIISQLLQSGYIARDYNPADTKHNTNKGYRIFSKYPLSCTTPIFDHTDNIIGIYADIEFQGQKARIFNIHLRSIKLGYDDYDFIDQIDKKNNSEQVSGVRNIYNKLTKAYAMRVRQAEMVRRLMENSPFPVILCGDFNEPPVSYCYREIRRNDLLDAFCESGAGWGSTVRLKFLRFRIDYIIHSPMLESTGFATHRENLSDHYAISCKFKFRQL
ncbi:MAG: endonuclease/exonuclease/phosphatase family protein [Bacteroidales bacterium]|nr:endonuclease/exonuclease/phosphatase family protein [Bacteroidales bacterium]